MDKFMLCVVALITVAMLILGNLRRPAWRRVMRSGKVGRRAMRRQSANDSGLEV